MTWISCFWAYRCQSVLNNENRKLVCLCCRGVTRHYQTEALLCVGWVAQRRKGYLRTDYTSATPRPWTALRCGSWQWSVRNHLLPWDCRDISRHLLSALTYVSCSWVWDCEKSVAVRKGISELPLEHLGAAYQMCRAAGLPPPSVQGSRRGIGHRRECVLVMADTGSKWQRGGGNQVCSLGKLLIILVVTVLGSLHQLLCRQTSSEASRSSQES